MMGRFLHDARYAAQILLVGSWITGYVGMKLHSVWASIVGLHLGSLLALLISLPSVIVLFLWLNRMRMDAGVKLLSLWLLLLLSIALPYSRLFEAYLLWGVLQAGYIVALLFFAIRWWGFRRGGATAACGKGEGRRFLRILQRRIAPPRDACYVSHAPADAW